MGLAVGGFFSQIPMPLQSLPSVLIAMMLRANLPVAIAGCWISNPVTMAPFIFLQLKIGSILIGKPMIAWPYEGGWMELLKTAPVQLIVGGTVMGAGVAAVCHFLGGVLYDFVVRRISAHQARRKVKKD